MTTDQNTTSEENTDDQGMSLIDHMVELRNRLGICVAVFLVIFIGSLIRPFGTDSKKLC